jgi:hypothetical protein
MQHSTSTAISSAEKGRKKTKLMADGKGIDRLAWVESALTHQAESVRYKEGKESFFPLFFPIGTGFLLASRPPRRFLPNGLAASPAGERRRMFWWTMMVVSYWSLG